MTPFSAMMLPRTDEGIFEPKPNPREFLVPVLSRICCRTSVESP